MEIPKKSLSILKKYWGYDSFRPPQDKVIEDILQQKDSLALLPTGGGKSICFQVPALQLPGVCIVISPLIALMKDQVQNLTKRGVKAAALYSGMRYREIETTIENCKKGGIKLLYLSPERLQSEDIRARFKYLDISFIAIDEAHCISQWGYDFRPPYLKIAEFREEHPKIPVMALTATATPKVAKDIMEKLGFSKPNLISKSFERTNLAYQIAFTEDKWGEVLKLFNREKGSGIIYTRSRKLTKEIAQFLNRNGISADYYHAGLPTPLRDEKQGLWQIGKTRIIVATNAFGMGIDKPDVRLVVHLNLPDNLESYFQEAGRGGRDEKPAKAVSLIQQSDIDQLKYRASIAFPPKKKIRVVYTALGNYFQLATGGGENQTFDFDLQSFCKRFNLNLFETHNALSILEREGYLTVFDPFETYSRVQFTVPYEQLYKYQITNVKLAPLIRLLLRNHAGMFDHLVVIKEAKIAHSLNSKTEAVKKALRYLSKTKILSFIEAKNTPQLTYLKERIPSENVSFSKAVYEDRKKDHETRVNSLISFVENNRVCRSRQLLSYFGEQQDKNCGVCDVCLKNQNKKSNRNSNEESIKLQIEQLLIGGKLIELEDLFLRFNREDLKAVKEVVNWMIENRELELTLDQKIKLTKA